MRFRTRRVIAVVILVTLVTSLSPVTKGLIVMPLLVNLLIDWDNWNYREGMKNR